MISSSYKMMRWMVAIVIGFVLASATSVLAIAVNTNNVALFLVGTAVGDNGGVVTVTNTGAQNIFWNATTVQIGSGGYTPAASI